MYKDKQVYYIYIYIYIYIFIYTHTHTYLIGGKYNHRSTNDKTLLS